MFSSVPEFRAELRDRLVEVLPEAWEIVPDLMAANVSLVPAVYIEFTAIDAEFQGAPLGPGQAAASVDLVVVDPRSADGEAEAAIEDELVPVLRAIDAHSDIAWSKATKVRLDSGPLSWRVNLTALVTL
jgi:hypothetical protein